MSMHDVEDETRDLTSDALSRIVRLNRGRVSRKQAVRALLGRNQRRPVQVARFIFEANEVDVDDKRAALKALGRSTERGAQELLFESLKDPDLHVLRDAVWSLARIGSEDALERLEQVDPRQSERLQQDLDRARRLLAFRLGLKGFGFDRRRLPNQASLPQDNLQEMVQTKVDPEKLERARKVLSLEAASLDLVTDQVAQVTCLKQDLWLMPTKAVAGAPESLMERPSVAMAIFAHNGCTGAPYLKSYVLTEPGEGGADIFVTRTRGQPTHVGRAKVDREGLFFDMAALQTRYDPAIQLSGLVSRDGALKLDKAVVSGDVTAVAKQRLRPSESPLQTRDTPVEPRSGR